MASYQRPTTVPSAQRGIRTSGDTGGLNRPIGGSGDGLGMGPVPPGSYNSRTGLRQAKAKYGATPKPNPTHSKLIPHRGPNSAYDACEDAEPKYGASGIKIKPSHKGLLHKDTGTPMGQKIPKAKIEAAANSPNPKVRKRAVFAENFGHDAVAPMPAPHPPRPRHRDGSMVGPKMARPQMDAEPSQAAVSNKIETNMREMKAGRLHSGSKAGPEVTNPKQAIAISYSQARKGKE